MAWLLLRTAWLLTVHFWNCNVGLSASTICLYCALDCLSDSPVVTKEGMEHKTRLKFLMIG